MIEIEPPALDVLGGLVMLVALFVLREIVSGALKEAGKELWRWVRRRRGGSQERRYALPFSEVVPELNAFWQRTFAAAGLRYRAPSIKTLETSILTACGPAGPEYAAFYCPPEEAIYVSPAWLDAHRQRIGDFAPIVVMAHEWGHHLQALLAIGLSPGKAAELQADCLAGAYARHAAQRGLLDPGDITEAVAMAAAVGDPLGLPQDTPDAHGINDERITAFMRGYLDGIEACIPTEEASSRCEMSVTGSPLMPIKGTSRTGRAAVHGGGRSGAGQLVRL